MQRSMRWSHSVAIESTVLLLQFRKLQQESQKMYHNSHTKIDFALKNFQSTRMNRQKLENRWCKLRVYWTVCPFNVPLQRRVYIIVLTRTVVVPFSGRSLALSYHRFHFIGQYNRSLSQCIGCFELHAWIPPKQRLINWLRLPII